MCIRDCYLKEPSQGFWNHFGHVLKINFNKINFKLKEKHGRALANNKP